MERIKDWHIRVKNAASRCNFNAYLAEAIKDKFVTGLLPGPIQERLYVEDPSRSVGILLELALNKESAVVRSCQLQAQINKLPLMNESERKQLRKRQRLIKQNPCVKHVEKGTIILVDINTSILNVENVTS